MSKIAITPILTISGVSAYDRSWDRWVCGYAIRWLSRQKNCFKSGTKLRLHISKHKLEGGRRVFIGFQGFDTSAYWNLRYSTCRKDWSFPNGDISMGLHGLLALFICVNFPNIREPEQFYVKLIILDK